MVHQPKPAQGLLFTVQELMFLGFQMVERKTKEDRMKNMKII